MFGYIHAHYYVTTRCNSRCITCDIWRKDEYRKTPESPLERRIALLRDLKGLGIKSIDFTGGEPLLYEGLPELIREAGRMGFVTALTNNGLLYPRYAEALRGSVTFLNFSVDSPRPDEHDRIRGIPCFDKVVSSIKLATSLGERVLIKHTVTDENYEDLPGMVDLARRLGVMVELSPEFTYFGNPGLDRDKVRALRRWFRHPNTYVNLAHLRFVLDGGNRAARPKCRVGRSVLVLSPDHALYFPCFHISRARVPIEGSLKELLETEAVKREVEKVGRWPFCEGCDIPCYMDVSYFAEPDRYFFINLIGKGAFVAKRLRLHGLPPLKKAVRGRWRI